MKIYLDQIPEAGLELNESCQPATLDLAREDISFSGPMELSAQITKEVSTIAVKLRIKGNMYLTCNRCLEEFSMTFYRELTLNFPIEKAKEIDLIDNVREEIILNYPLKPLCRQDCSGLCPVCGQNLNKGRCGCQVRPKLAEGNERKLDGRI
ncbi:MAG: DUF177 domain-containing protein [Candidatus Omnitrophica bacterium]|nr:DUF177 domain-containing protein [Candidatus Omnitrophota bacterium]